MDSKECEKTHFFYDGLLCAETNHRQCTCRGDSGGPLVYYSASGAPILIGITSYGPSAQNRVMVSQNYFTRVSYFSD